MIVSGYLCEYGFAGGWPSVFYVHGVVAAVCLIIWVVFITNEPSEHGSISTHELEFIVHNLGSSTTQDTETELKIPWRGILCSPAIWSIGIAKFAGKWGFITWETQLPTYLARALHMNMKEVSKPLRLMTVHEIPFDFSAK